jgi:hypothetical protein
MVRQVKSMLRRALLSGALVDWTQLVPWVMSAINSTVSRTTTFAPHEVFFGEPPRPLVAESPGAVVPFNFGEMSQEELAKYMAVLKRKIHAIKAKAASAQEDHEE